jgi:toxin ParE1/3/4
VRVVLSAEARANLVAIEEYIAGDNPTRAQSFVSELRTRIKQIGRYPRSSAVVPGYESRGIRRRPYRNYLIFYRIESSRVVIIAVIHGARDYDPLLDADE